MSRERLEQSVARFARAVSENAPPPVKTSTWLGESKTAQELLQSMLTARALDVAAHQLRERGVGHYTICSSGHEGNAVLGRLSGPSDPALLHYRSAAFQLERARQVGGIDPVQDIAYSLVASKKDPISGGRHKVFGRKELGIAPQTSTIASHLPRAMGTAVSLGLEGQSARSSSSNIVIASVGDASLNHSTSIGAINTASWTSYLKLPVPLLILCEDNGLGISVRTPEGWVAHRLRSFKDFAYFTADGWDIPEAWHAANRAVAHCRKTQRPAFLHLKTARLLGHAGSDADAVYRKPAEIRRAADRDPVLCFALKLLQDGHLQSADVLRALRDIDEQVRTACDIAEKSPRLTTRAEVMEAIARPPVAPHSGQRAEREGAGRKARPKANSGTSRAPASGDALPATLAQGIQHGLGEILETVPKALLFGEDVAKKGGVYGVTKGLLGRFGPARVWNTLLDEQSILGLALGAAGRGYLPIPEIQYLAYVHNAIDQLRGEAATLPFFSAGQFDNPMIVRIASFGYQKGFGGHFHNDNSTAALREIPGLTLGVPTRADDAVLMLRTAKNLALDARRVVAFLEPIALYHTRDLEHEGDQGWLTDLSGLEGDAAPLGRARVYPADSSKASKTHLTIATYGNGVHMSRRAARVLGERGIRAEVLDLRWLAPLPIEDIVRHSAATGHLLVVDEGRKTGGVSETIAAEVLDAGVSLRFKRVVGADSFIPLGEAANLVLPQPEEIVEAALSLVGTQTAQTATAL